MNCRQTSSLYVERFRYVKILCLKNAEPSYMKGKARSLPDGLILTYLSFVTKISMKPYVQKKAPFNQMN